MESRDLLIVEKKVFGNIIVWSDSQYNAIDADHVVVMENVVVRLFGTAKKITLRKSSTAVLHGSVEEIVNEGGTLEIFD